MVSLNHSGIYNANSIPVQVLQDAKIKYNTEYNNSQPASQQNSHFKPFRLRQWKHVTGGLKRFLDSSHRPYKRHYVHHHPHHHHHHHHHDPPYPFHHPIERMEYIHDEIEPIEHAESIEPIEGIEAIEPIERIENIEPAESIDHIEHMSEIGDEETGEGKSKIPTTTKNKTSSSYKKHQGHHNKTFDSYRRHHHGNHHYLSKDVNYENSYRNKHYHYNSRHLSNDGTIVNNTQFAAKSKIVERHNNISNITEGLQKRHSGSIYNNIQFTKSNIPEQDNSSTTEKSHKRHQHKHHHRRHHHRYHHKKRQFYPPSLNDENIDDVQSPIKENKNLRLNVTNDRVFTLQDGTTLTHQVHRLYTPIEGAIGAQGVDHPATGATGVQFAALGVTESRGGVTEPATGVTDPATGVTDPATGVTKEAKAAEGAGPDTKFEPQKSIRRHGILNDLGTENAKGENVSDTTENLKTESTSNHESKETALHTLLHEASTDSKNNNHSMNNASLTILQEGPPTDLLAAFFRPSKVSNVSSSQNEDNINIINRLLLLSTTKNNTTAAFDNKPGINSTNTTTLIPSFENKTTLPHDRKEIQRDSGSSILDRLNKTANDKNTLSTIKESIQQSRIHNAKNGSVKQTINTTCRANVVNGEDETRVNGQNNRRIAAANGNKTRTANGNEENNPRADGVNGKIETRADNAKEHQNAAVTESVASRAVPVNGEKREVFVPQNAIDPIQPLMEKFKKPESIPSIKLLKEEIPIENEKIPALPIPDVKPIDVGELKMEKATAAPAIEKPELLKPKIEDIPPIDKIPAIPPIKES